MAGAFQCMFIRGAIFTLTKKHGSNKAARNADLRTIFRHLEFKHDDTLNIQCTRLVDVMSRRWNGIKSRDEFVARFSADKATRLDVASRSKHSLGVCQECERFSEWVESFPYKGKGMGKHLPGSAGSSSVETQTTPTDEAAAVLNVCADITDQEGWGQKFGRTFVESLVATGVVQAKETPAQRNALKKRIATEFRDREMELFAETSVGAILQNRLSFAKYERLRKAKHFESPADREERYKLNPPKRRSHVRRVDLDADSIISSFESWPAGVAINWTESAKKFNLEGGNAGQILKDLVREYKGDDFCLALECRTTPRRKVRSKHRRIAFGVTSAIEPSAAAIKVAIESKIQKGEYVVGEPVCEQKINRLVIENGEVTASEVAVAGRSIPLSEIRTRLLAKHASLMRTPQTGEVIKRHLRISHDHAAIGGHSWLMEVVQVMYDPRIHLTAAEVQTNTPERLSIQTFVEEPQIRLFVMCKSSDKDMVCTTPARLRDMGSASQAIPFVNNSTVVDEVLFFSGDLQARWYELGVQKGGRYKCGSGCGCPSSDIPAYSQQVVRPIPTLADLQARATAGHFGRLPGFLNLHTQVR